MWFLWALMQALGYYLAPTIGLWLWLSYIFALRSGWLRGLALGVMIIILVSSLNLQLIPSYNIFWLLLLGLSLCLPHFLPTAPQARPYHLATQALLLSLSLALHLWYCYLSERLLFNPQFSYYAAPCLSLAFLLSSLIIPRQKSLWLRLGVLAVALALGTALGQFFDTYA
jgi:hypothetical protein